MTTATSALDRLTAAHHHHVLRLMEHTETLHPGTPARLIACADPNTFFTGIRRGDVVVVTGRGASVTRVEGNSAHLGVYDPNGSLRPLPLSEWTREHAQAAAREAERAADEALERAYCSANRLLGAPGSDDAALASLRVAKARRDFAFAAKVYADYLPA